LSDFFRLMRLFHVVCDQKSFSRRSRPGSYGFISCHLVVALVFILFRGCRPVSALLARKVFVCASRGFEVDRSRVVDGIMFRISGKLVRDRNVGLDCCYEAARITRAPHFRNTVEREGVLDGSECEGDR